MSKQPPGIMTPDKYLQTDEETLLEIAPHWKLFQVFPREPRRVGYNCGAMFYIGTEGSTGTGKPDMVVCFTVAPAWKRLHSRFQRSFR